MIATPAVRAIVGTLTEAGYRSLPMPTEIAAVPFDFCAMLVGAGNVPDLIVVADTSVDPAERICQKIEALGRALDVLQSRRPLTLLLPGPRPRSASLDALTRVCRLLIVDAADLSGRDLLRDKLAILLPLEITELAATLADPLGELSQLTESSNAKSAVDDLVAASSGGPDRVRQRLKDMLEKPLTRALNGES